jgi:hypothetical protein
MLGPAMNGPEVFGEFMHVPLRTRRNASVVIGVIQGAGEALDLHF